MKAALDGENDPRVPKDYLTRNLIGHFHFMWGVSLEPRDWLRARREFDAAARVAPDNDVLFFNLGLIYARNGLYDDALSAFERSHAINQRPLPSGTRPRASERIAEIAAERARVAALEASLAGEEALRLQQWAALPGRSRWRRCSRRAARASPRAAIACAPLRSKRRRRASVPSGPGAPRGSSAWPGRSPPARRPARAPAPGGSAGRGPGRPGGLCGDAGGRHPTGAPGPLRPRRGRLLTGGDLPRGIPVAISKTAQYALVALGVSWAVLASGMEVSRFGFLVGTLGVGIGFGLQNVVNNFVSGLILLYERPVQAGDIVELGAVSGEVTRIGVRSSTVRTFAGAEEMERRPTRTPRGPGRRRGRRR